MMLAVEISMEPFSQSCAEDTFEFPSVIKSTMPMRQLPCLCASPVALQWYFGAILVVTLLTVGTSSLQRAEDVRISALTRAPGEQVRPNRTTQYTLETLPYRIPHTQTVLDLRYGQYIDPQHINAVLALVHDDIARLMPKSGGAKAAVSDGEYDCETEDKIAFSVYSPSEVPPGERLTWLILENVVDGLVDLLLLGKIHRQVNFRILYGRQRRFVGYGHLVQGIGIAPE
ncbi:MAG: hypothetical protein Q9182_001897 [Xanthomendoza sp. 2 TL-2023]